MAEPGSQGGGLIVAAPASGSGKTVLTLGLLRHLARSGAGVVSAKVGPDYIDPAFHAAATGRPCLNLDPWAMDRARLGRLAWELSEQAPLVVCEGVMGLFDGATAFEGSTADLAALLGWPVVLVVDARAQGASAAAVVRGFAGHRRGVELAGVVFNQVAGEKHARVLEQACHAALPDLPLLGFVPRVADLAVPGRHLGLVQALEHPDLTGFLDRAADLVGAHVDVDRLTRLAAPMLHRGTPAAGPPPLPPLGNRIAVADDAAFAFRYPLVVQGWRQAGAEILPFSPLAGDGPDETADAVYLPGGYPELHAGRLAAATGFFDGLRAAAARGATVFGECGGYMVLGRGLVDAEGTRHAMAGLLPLETSFAERRLHLGYRRATLAGDGPLGAEGTIFRGHEFHYASIRDEGPAHPLFHAQDAQGREVDSAGLVSGSVMGSFIHLIDREAA